MPFVKVQKSRSYFKRFQVKFARRRAGKTDYRARKRLAVTDKNKYSSPRYRLVVRLTNRFVIAQIVYSEIDGDRVLASAYSSELSRYGLKVGLKNYPACYCTGLLIARRTLAKLGLSDLYEGQAEVTAEVVLTTHTNDAGKTRNYWVSEVSAERKPFRAVLDVGIRTTTTGSRVFGVLKGAADGGLDIPHNEKRFPGYNRDSKEYDVEFHKERITGKHLADYMEELKDDDAEGYARRFSTYVKAGVKASKLEELYEKVHAAIRADPAPGPTSTFKWTKEFKHPAKSTTEQRAEAVRTKKENRVKTLLAQTAAGGDDEDDE